ncbi:MAG: hypothetical protein HN742_23730 [Lentisphaerae bacterium]|nr:hypothetical protein [Lentisphaerota bacterium]MBT5607605.1 hypothetical protein [Lentisphaerota bacterium]MBT7059829.1 hypothetical protein [Lentisphaerota bacterium]MBT7844907.1 hypothetical protein [Lentisphaerota bacterium]
MSRWPIPLMVSMLVLETAGADPPYVATGENLVQNPGFEDGADRGLAGWAVPPAVYGADRTVSRNGKRSLRSRNDDSARYLLCGQSIELKAGSRYAVKAWVRTEGVTGGDSGATICIEWRDANGNYLGGYYPPGRKGDTEQWTEIGGSSMRVPREAVRGSVTCYVRPGMSGTAWWDDVSVRRVRQPPIYGFVTSPPYRGWITDGGPGHVKACVSVIPHEIAGGPEAARIVARVTRDQDGDLVGRSDPADITGEEVRLRVPLPDLAPGSYRLTIALVDREDNETLYEETHRLERRGGAPPECFVDEHNRLIVDGEPFFPLGMYWGMVTEDQLRVYADSPFNCLMPYCRPNDEQMDLIHGLGLKAIYSIKDCYYGTHWCPGSIKSEADEEGVVRKLVRHFREHPALLAWYINDELPLSMLPRLEAHQRWVEEEDPGHPTWTVLYQVDDVRCYTKSFDVVGTDPYPIPDLPAAVAGQWTEKTRKAVADARGVWMVPQVFRKPKAEHPPTFDELRSMTWQCITEGAKGIVFYSWFGIWDDESCPFEQRWPQVRRVAEEVSRLAPVLLSADPTPAVTVTGPEAVHWTVRSHRGTVYAIVVNDGEQAVSASVRFPRQPKRVMLGDRPVEVVGQGGFSVPLAPLGVAIYRIEM